MIHAGLILEGGGMRGAYTAGVLDYFMEKGMWFDHAYGVSAGACHLCSYISKQPGRAIRIALNYLQEPYYCSFKSLMESGDLFNVDFNYNRVPNELDPYDYDTADKWPGKAYAVATNIETGKAEYLPMTDTRHSITAVQASASLPLVSRNVEYEGKYYLDGGVADSIPLRRSLKDGNKKNIVVLTRPAGYRKKPQSISNAEMMLAKYPKYPNLRRAMHCRPYIYNKTLDLIERLEGEGRIVVLRPESLIQIERIEKDPKKLKILYLQGYHDAAMNLEVIRNYLEI
ncbi:MAG: patatin family protein [Lachnospiraceae bacterium]|nr:patatin family protein [Lachnospiraceae bacterium]